MWGGVQRSDLDRETARANLATAERNLRGLGPSHAPGAPAGGRGLPGSRVGGGDCAGATGGGSGVMAWRGPAPGLGPARTCRPRLGRADRTCRSDFAAPTWLDACMRAHGSMRRAHARAHICTHMDLAQARAHTPSLAAAGRGPPPEPASRRPGAGPAALTVGDGPSHGPVTSLRAGEPGSQYHVLNRAPAGLVTMY
jgi:hypothetical protein